MSSYGRYSTDYVFDGGPAGGEQAGKRKRGAQNGTGGGVGGGPYGEEDTPSPLNVYGSSKLQGEKLVLEADPGALVVRTNVIFGPEGVGKNFA